MSSSTDHLNSLPMSSVLKGREMKRLKAGLQKASATACVLCVKEVRACSRQDGSDERRHRDDAPYS
jgi:hypothetical protein